MTKDEFFKLCMGACYGNSEEGYISLRVEVRGDPTAHISGNAGIYLVGHFRGNFFRTVYSPHQKYGPTRHAWEQCEQQLSKYERWLGEWLEEHPPATSLELCEICNGPIVINDEPSRCWCKRPLPEGDGSQMAPSDEEISQKKYPQ